jgi:hypothetical protein
VNNTEIERLKTALALTREHNIKLIEENQRLRAGLGLFKPVAPNAPVLVKVHPNLMPPPEPEPRRRLQRRDLYAGDRPLRTQWPLG